MKISDLDFSACEMPLEDKDWKFALASVSSARGWVVEVRSDSGHVGYGYAPAVPHMGSTFESLPHELEPDPATGTEVNEGTVVKVTFSCGPPQPGFCNR